MIRICPRCKGKGVVNGRFCLCGGSGIVGKLGMRSEADE